MTEATFYVVDSSNGKCTQCLLSAMTAQQLGVVQFAFSSFCNSVSAIDEFPALFDGKMGKVTGVQVKLHIDEKVQPVSQMCRRVPFHVRKDVEKELKHLEEQDVIEKVSGPTPWVSPIETERSDF